MASFERQGYSWSSLLFGYSIFLGYLIFYFISKRWPNQIDYCFALASLNAMILQMEVFHETNIDTSNSVSRPAWIYFDLGMLFYICILVTWLAKIPWILLLTIVFITELFFCFRISNEDAYPRRYEQIINLCSRVLILCYVFYFTERKEREIYHKSYTHKKYIQEYENLLTNQIPMPVLIAKNDQELQNYIYSNKSMKSLLENTNLLNMLNIETNDHIIEVLEKNSEKRIFFEAQKMQISWNEEIAWLYVLADVSVLKELDGQKDRLMHSVSHDLRTPISGIIGLIEVSLESDNLQYIKEKLGVSLKTANGLNLMINDLLDLAQIQNGKLKFVQEKVNLSELLQEVIEIFTFKFKEKGLQYYLIPTQMDLQQTVSIDGNRLKQILFNLISNAFKFTFQGQIAIHVSEESIDNEIYLKFIIEDTGIGIKEEDKSKLFQLFGKLENEDQSINKYGVGLGLHNCQNILKLQNEKLKVTSISVDSELGKGAKFTFYFAKFKFENRSKHSKAKSEISENADFQIKEDEEIGHNVKILSCTPCNKGRFFEKSPKSTPFSEIEVESIPSVKRERWTINPELKKNYKILVVEDDAVCQEAILCYFQDTNIQLLSASNGEEAINCIQNQKENCSQFDVILMDCEMPIMNGQKASKMIKEMIEKSIIPKVPIVAMTGNVSMTDIAKCIEGNMDYYLTKPVKKGQMYAKINEVLKTQVFLRSS